MYINRQRKYGTVAREKEDCVSKERKPHGLFLWKENDAPIYILTTLVPVSKGINCVPFYLRLRAKRTQRERGCRNFQWHCTADASREGTLPSPSIGNGYGHFNLFYFGFSLRIHRYIHRRIRTRLRNARVTTFPLTNLRTYTLHFDS